MARLTNYRIMGGTYGLALLAGCGAGGSDRHPPSADAESSPKEVDSPCALVSVSEVAAIVGPIRKQPKEKRSDFGSYCKYEFGSQSAPRYVELIWSDAATFGGMTSDGPDSTRIEGSLDYIVHRRAVAGLGARAFLLNLNGLEYALWVLDGQRSIAVQAVLGPEELEKFKALAARQLAASQ